jgi:hypothetical protein
LESVGQICGFRRTRPVVSRRFLHRSVRQSGVYHQSARSGLARHGRGAFAFFVVFAAARRGNFAFANGTPFENALEVAKFLQNHEQVEWVNYPGLETSEYYDLAAKYLPNGAGAIVTFGIKGGYEAGKKFINSVKLFSLRGQHRRREIAGHSSGFDDAFAINRRRTGDDRRHAGFGSFSVGIEDVRDILADLDAALRGENEKLPEVGETETDVSQIAAGAGGV